MVKNLPASAGDAGSVSRLGRSPGEGDGKPRQSSCLENPMDRGAWRAAVRRVGRDLATKQLFCNVFFYPLVTHSSILAWKIPWMEEPGRLQSRVTKSRTRLSDFTSLSTLRVCLTGDSPHNLRLSCDVSAGARTENNLLRDFLPHHFLCTLVSSLGTFF